MGEGTYPTARSIRHAICVLERLPLEALFELADRLIELLDAAEPDRDLEPETDVCDAGECGGLLMSADKLPGDSTDAEPDDEDCGGSEDEPSFGLALSSTGAARRVSRALPRVTGRGSLSATGITFWDPLWDRGAISPENRSKVLQTLSPPNPRFPTIRVR